MITDRPLPIATLVLTLCLFGCTDRKAESVLLDAPGSKTLPDATGSGEVGRGAATDQWLGQWTGPEGTYLRIAGGKGLYEITIRNLDGPSVFKGSSVNGKIQFERNGAAETIRATNGKETGMKWLSEKSNCLTVRPGEGYCRD